MSHEQRRIMVELNPLDHFLLDAQEGTPWAPIAHAVLGSAVLDLQTAQNLCGNGVLLINRLQSDRRINQKEPDSCAAIGD